MKQNLVDRLGRLPGGRRKARKTRKMISRVQNFAGYREYPKYLMMRHYWILKAGHAHRGVRSSSTGGVIQRADDVYYLSFAEFREAVRTGHVDHDLIARRSEEFEAWTRLTPPRVITSDGEVPAGGYDRARVPAGALAGIPASAGTVEGRARIVRDLTDTDLRGGRHSGHDVHRPELDADLPVREGRGHRGRRRHDPRRRRRAGVRTAGGGRRGRRHEAHPRWSTNPSRRHRRIRPDPLIGNGSTRTTTDRSRPPSGRASGQVVAELMATGAVVVGGKTFYYAGQWGRPRRCVDLAYQRAVRRRPRRARVVPRARRAWRHAPTL